MAEQQIRNPKSEIRNPTESDIWDNVKQIIGERRMTLGHHWSFNLRNDPKRFPFVLSRYKFAAKMACKDARVLELGCSEGIGTPILAEFARRYVGVDMDEQAIEAAQQNFAAPVSSDPNKRCERLFIADDFLNKTFGEFDVVVSLDVVEHIVPEIESQFFDTVAANLTNEGVAVIGTPNQTSDQYASEMSKAGHVNLFTADHLMQAMRRVFHNVLPFGLNDELVHTGFAPMMHYLVFVGCNKKY